MGEFFKDFSLSFFSQKRAKNIYKRSFVITFINVIILFFALFLSAFLSQEVSFNYYLNDSGEFIQVLTDAIPSGSSIINGKFNANSTYNSFIDDYYSFNDKGYHVIIDTRPSATTFDTFSFVMRNENNDQIDFETYQSLNENEKEQYSPVINRSGVVLDTVSNIKTYENLLEPLNNEDFKQLQNSYKNHLISDLDYANKIYILYCQNLYPEAVCNCDSFGGVPTIRSYNASLINGLDIEENYIFIYEDGIESSFTSKEKLFNFYGYFDNVDELDFSPNDIDTTITFINTIHKDATSLRAVVHLLISFFTWFLLVIIFCLFVLLVRFALSLVYKNQPHYLLKIMNLTSSFFLFSSVISTICGIFAGFFLQIETIIVLTPLMIFILTSLRTILYYVLEKNANDYIKEEL